MSSSYSSVVSIKRQKAKIFYSNFIIKYFPFKAWKDYQFYNLKKNIILIYLSKQDFNFFLGCVPVLHGEDVHQIGSCVRAPLEL